MVEDKYKYLLKSILIMKGITANKFYTYLSILLAIIALVSVYVSLPQMVWIIQTGTINNVCPNALNDKSETYIQLMNGGKIPASFNINFASDKIKFIDDYGKINDSFTIAYYVDAGQSATFKFKPTFNDSVKDAYIQIKATCETYFGKFCKNFEMYKCCRYSTKGYSHQLLLTEEANGKC
jgi:hypothetical protein